MIVPLHKPSIAACEDTCVHGEDREALNLAGQFKAGGICGERVGRAQAWHAWTLTFQGHWIE